MKKHLFCLAPYVFALLCVFLSFRSTAQTERTHFGAKINMAIPLGEFENSTNSFQPNSNTVPCFSKGFGPSFYIGTILTDFITLRSEISYTFFEGKDLDLLVDESHTQNKSSLQVLSLGYDFQFFLGHKKDKWTPYLFLGMSADNEWLDTKHLRTQNNVPESLSYTRGSMKIGGGYNFETDLGISMIEIGYHSTIFGTASHGIKVPDVNYLSFSVGIIL